MSSLPDLTFIQQRGTPATETDIRSTTGVDNLAASWAAQGIQSTTLRPVAIKWRGDIYLAGSYTRVLVRPILDGIWVPASIVPPNIQLSVVPGSGAGGSSGSCLAFITFLHKAGAVVLAESARSNVVNVGTLTGEGRLWTNIALTGEARATHVRGYVSMNGAGYRMAWEAQIGISSVEENIPTSRLSISGPAIGQNSLPPIGVKFAHAWAGRMWYASTPEFPYRLWYSDPGNPQSVRPASFRDTFEREEITSIWKGRNELLVFCIRSAYLVRQFGTGQNDFVIEKLDSDVGCITHFGIAEIHNRLWFPAEDGIWIYDGGFHYMMKDLRLLWQQEYAADKDAFVQGFGGHDKINKVYLFFTNRAARPAWENTGLNPGTVRYVGYYGDFEPSMAGQQLQPDWTLDFATRFDSAALYDKDGKLIVASCDGIIRSQDSLNGDDDGDILQKQLIIRHGHMLMLQPGDDVQSAKKLEQLWLHVESESQPWTLYAMGGDASAYLSVRPDNDFKFWRYVSPASAQTEVRTVDGVDYTYVFAPESVHFFIPEKVAGRGFTFEIQATAPVGLNYRGVGGMWSAGGPAYRPPVSITPV